jgi:hypothetical protein
LVITWQRRIWSHHFLCVYRTSSRYFNILLNKCHLTNTLTLEYLVLKNRNGYNDLPVMLTHPSYIIKYNTLFILNNIHLISFQMWSLKFKIICYYPVICMCPVGWENQYFHKEWQSDSGRIYLALGRMQGSVPQSVLYDAPCIMILCIFKSLFCAILHLV